MLARALRFFARAGATMSDVARPFALAAGGRVRPVRCGAAGFQGLALLGPIPTLEGAAVALLVPIGLSAALVAYAGRETRGRSLRALESGI